MNDYFCKMPFMALEISNDGSITPCCSFKHRNLREPDGTLLNVNNMNITEAVNGETFTKLRQDMLSGEPVDGCSKCYDVDSHGGSSHRKRFNRQFAHIDIKSDFKFDLKSLDIKLSNVCNQMCIICNPFASSMIAAESKIISPDSYKKIKFENFNWYKNEELWKNIHDSLENIEHIDFYGGEPWLIKKHWELLEYIIDKGYSKNIKLNYATNGSLFNQMWFDKYFSKFKDVSILLSADGIKETFEYNRYPAKWNDFERNLNSIRDIVLNTDIISWLGISYTLSAYSVSNLIESLEYYTSLDTPVWLNLVNEEYQDVSVLPKALKQELIREIKNNWNQDFCLVDNIDHTFITDRLEIEVDKKHTSKFIEKTVFLDNHRKNSFLDIEPRIRDLYYNAN